MGRLFRALLGIGVGLFAWAYLRTLRLRVVVDPSLDASDPRPWVLVFWHGDQFPLLAWKRRRRTVALVSLSHDGQIQAQALRRVGLWVERGSSTRGGAAGLLAIVRRLRGGFDAAFAVDGPRGPRFSVAPGAAAAARRAGAWLVPMGSACAKAHTFERAWDRYRLPWPGSRIVVALGPALAAERTSLDDLKAAIARASEHAEAELASWMAEGRRIEVGSPGQPP